MPLLIRLKEEQLKKQQEQHQRESETGQAKEKGKNEEDAHKMKQEEDKQKKEEQEKELQTQIDKEVGDHYKVSGSSFALVLYVLHLDLDFMVTSCEFLGNL